MGLKVNNFVNNESNTDNNSQTDKNESSPDFSKKTQRLQNIGEANQIYQTDGDAPHFGKISQDIHKLQSGNMNMRELLQQAGIAVASLAKTSYLFKKQNKANIELFEAKEQDCMPDV